MSERTEPAAREAFVEYILSNQYRRLLYRALLSRLGTTSANHAAHEKAIDLMEAAFPDIRA